jgi:hypothetical protein
MLNVHLDKQSVAATRKILEDLGESFDKAINVAISKTVKKVKTQASRRLRQVIAAPTKVLKRAVTRGKVGKRSNVVSVTVYLQAGHPIPLKYFKPTSPKKGKLGVIVQEFAGTRRRIPDGFMNDKWGKSVYRRAGKERRPLDLQHGVKPGDVMQSHGIDRVAVSVANEELPKQLKERIRFLTVKAQDRLRNQKSAT